jgi:membrane protein implicated in regulation of membrane protease activity
MLRTAVAALITLVVILVASMLLASIIGLGPAEFWILPGLFLSAVALVTLVRRRRRQSVSSQHS